MDSIGYLFGVLRNSFGCSFLQIDVDLLDLSRLSPLAKHDISGVDVGSGHVPLGCCTALCLILDILLPNLLVPGLDRDSTALCLFSPGGGIRAAFIFDFCETSWGSGFHGHWNVITTVCRLIGRTSMTIWPHSIAPCVISLLVWNIPVTMPVLSASSSLT